MKYSDTSTTSALGSLSKSNNLVLINFFLQALQCARIAEIKCLQNILRKYILY